MNLVELADNFKDEYPDIWDFETMIVSIGCISDHELMRIFRLSYRLMMYGMLKSYKDVDLGFDRTVKSVHLFSNIILEIEKRNLKDDNFKRMIDAENILLKLIKE